MSLWLLVQEEMEDPVVFSLPLLLPLGMEKLEANAAGVPFPLRWPTGPTPAHSRLAGSTGLHSNP